MTRIFYNVVVTYLLTEAHAGYDFPWQLHHVVPFGLYGGAPRHEDHHRYGTVYFSQFFTWIDNGLGHTRTAK
jgi:hypothetical protein